MTLVMDEMFWVTKEQANMARVRHGLTLVQPANYFDKTSRDVEIPLWVEDGDLVGLPRQWGMRWHGAGDWTDLRSTKTANLNLVRPIGGPKFEHQPIAVRAMSDHLRRDPSGGGILQSGCGTGKTIMACAVAAELKMRVLVLVHKEFLARQWRAAAREWLGLPEDQIGHVQQDVCKFKQCSFVTAMVQSFAERDYPAELFTHFGLTIFDEVHRHAAPTWCEGFKRCRSKYRLGLSATPRRADGLEGAFWHHIGDVAHVVDTPERMTPLVLKLTVPQLCPEMKDRFGRPLEATMLSRLCGVGTKKVPGKKQKISVPKPNDGSIKRNLIIAREIACAAKAGRKIIVLSDRIAHLQQLREIVEKRGAFLHDYYVGGRKPEELRAAEGAQILWATWGMAQEGLDIPALDTLVMATPKTDVEQAAGRVLRYHSDKKAPFVVDVVDPFSVFQKKWERRASWYEGQGFEIRSQAALAQD